jgi:hypothetical protein
MAGSKEDSADPQKPRAAFHGDLQEVGEGTDPSLLPAQCSVRPEVKDLCRSPKEHRDSRPKFEAPGGGGEGQQDVLEVLARCGVILRSDAGSSLYMR